MTPFQKSLLPRSSKPTKKRLCKLEDGRWITIQAGRYRVGDTQVPCETALVALRERCATDPALDLRLSRMLPVEDYGLIEDRYLGFDYAYHWAQQERYVIELLAATRPPDFDWSYDFEALHRMLLTTDLSDSALSRAVPPLHLYLPGHLLGSILRSQLPETSPLSLWEVTSELRGSSASESDGEANRRIGRVWAYSEARIEGENAFWYRSVVSARRLTHKRVQLPATTRASGS